MHGRGGSTDLVERPLGARELKLGTGAMLALAGLAGLGTADASARVATDGGPPPTAKKPDSKPSSPPPTRTDASDGYAGLHDKPAAPAPRRPASPPTRTDASDGYAGMHDEPKPAPKPAPAPQPRPVAQPKPTPQPKPAAPPSHTDASDGYAGMRSKPAPVRRAPDKPAKAPAARKSPAKKPAAEPAPAPAAAPPTHTDASDGYAGMGDTPPPAAPPPTTAPAPTVAPVPTPAPPVPTPTPAQVTLATHTDASDGYAGLHDDPEPKPASKPKPAAAAPTHTDASDGYAGLRERPTAKPDKPVQPRPGSPLAKPIDQQVRDNLGTLGVQPPPPPAQLPGCLDPGYVAKGPDGKPIERPHAEPADPDRPRGWDSDYGYGPRPGEVDKATLGDLYRAGKWWVGDPLHNPEDAVGLVGWGKVYKYGRKGVRAVRGTKKAEEGAEAVTRTPAKPPTAPATPTTPGQTRYRHWTKQRDFEGQRVYQRDDLIDPAVKDKRRRTNLKRMQKGLAPLGPDGKPVNLHHATQSNDGALLEVSQSVHQKNTKMIHINPSSIPSGIDRKAFNRYRRRYWQERAKDFDPLRNLDPPSIAAP